MKYITSIMLFAFILYCCSDTFVSALLTPAKRTLIEEHIRNKRAGQDNTVQQNPLPHAWLSVEWTSEEEAIKTSLRKLQESQHRMQNGEIGGMICNLNLRSQKRFNTQKQYTERHYALFVEAPEPSSSHWVLQVVHDGKKEEKFYHVFRDKLAVFLNDPKRVKKAGPEQPTEQKVTIEFSRSIVKDYPFRTRDFMEVDRLRAYIRWVSCLCHELRDHEVSLQDVRDTIYEMDREEWSHAFSAYEDSRPSTVLEA